MAGIDVSEELSKKMLAGWCMMGECCPKCRTVPLMRAPNSTEMLCVSCNGWYSILDGGRIVPIKQEEEEPPKAEPVEKRPVEVEESESEEEIVQEVKVVKKIKKSSTTEQKLQDAIEELGGQLSANINNPHQVAIIADAINKCAIALESLRRL